MILRNDPSDYEPRPIMGRTYRECATIAVLVVVCVAAGVACWVLNVPDTLSGTIVMLAGALIGFVGMGRIDGLRTEKWWRIHNEDRSWPRVTLYAPPRVVTSRQRMLQKQKARRSGRQSPSVAEVDG